MILLDTDILTLYLNDHANVVRRFESASEVPAISIVSRIEVLQGRFAALIKAANENGLFAAQERLKTAEYELAKFVTVEFDVAAGAAFERLRQDKKIRRIGRPDLMIACIALANRATLVTRNVKDFHAVPGLRLENWAD